MTKGAWWLGFPRFKCPHCGTVIAGLKFQGRFKLPHVKPSEKKKEEVETAGE